MFRIIRNFLIALVLIFVAWYAIGRLVDKAAVRRLETKARKAGQPLTVKEFVATLPEVPDEENTALALIEIWKGDDPDYWAAFLAGERPERPKERQYDPDLPILGRNSGSPAPGQQLSSLSQTALEKYIEAQSNRIEAIRTALRRPHARYPIRFDETFSALLPHLPQVKAEAQTLRLAALRAAQEGDAGASLKAAQDIVRLSETLANDAPLISQLVRTACVRMALDSAEDLLSRQSISREQLNALETMVSSIEPRKALRLAMMSERVMSLNFFDDPGSVMASTDMPDMPNPRDASRGLGFLSFIGLTVGDRRLILETMEEVIAIAEDTSPKAFERSKKLEGELEKKLGGFPPKIFARLFLPSLSKATARFMALEARIRAARVALAVERYRLQHGKPPESLAALVPEHLKEIPIDPFDGQPLRYRQSATNYVVYSLGPDLQDSRGRTRGRAGSPEDEGFTVNR